MRIAFCVSFSFSLGGGGFSLSDIIPGAGRWHHPTVTALGAAESRMVCGSVSEGDVAKGIWKYIGEMTVEPSNRTNGMEK